MTQRVQPRCVDEPSRVCCSARSTAVPLLFHCCAFAIFHIHCADNFAGCPGVFGLQDAGRKVDRNTDNLADKASNALGDAKDAAKDAYNTVKDKVSNAADDVEGAAKVGGACHGVVFRVLLPCLAHCCTVARCRRGWPALSVCWKLTQFAACLL